MVLQIKRPALVPGSAPGTRASVLISLSSSPPLPLLPTSWMDGDPVSSRRRAAAARARRPFQAALGAGLSCVGESQRGSLQG